MLSWRRSSAAIGYRRLDTYGGLAGFRGHGGGCALEWLSDAVTMTQALGSPETTAQVHPDRFTAAMMRAAEAQGRHCAMAGLPAFRAVCRRGPETGDV